MLIEQPECPHCGASFIVEEALARSGATALRCPECWHDVPPTGRSEQALAQATRTTRPIEIWTPAAPRDFRPQPNGPKPH